MTPDSKLKYQGITKTRDRQGNEKSALFFSFGWPGAYYYESLTLSPTTVYNLLEDGKHPFLSFTMELTEEEINWLAAYDPVMGRGEKVEALLKQQQERDSTTSQHFNRQNQGPDQETKTVWLDALGTHLLAEEAWLINCGAPTATELQKAWNDWLEKNTQHAPCTSQKSASPS